MFIYEYYKDKLDDEGNVIGKEGYGNTIIIESDDITVWYSNIDNYTVKLYDRVESGKYLGETIDDKLYLVFQKNGDIVDYKDYI